jgi:hypothetical protein
VKRIHYSQLDRFLGLVASLHVAHSQVKVKLDVDCDLPLLPVRFVEALSDPSHSISQSLDALTVRVNAWMPD